MASQHRCINKHCARVFGGKRNDPHSRVRQCSNCGRYACKWHSQQKAPGVIWCANCHRRKLHSN